MPEIFVVDGASDAVRPKPRPAVAGLAVPADSTPGLPALASAAPPPRPDPAAAAAPDPDAGKTEKPVFRDQTGGQASSARRASVCGDPALKGVKVPSIPARLPGCGLTGGVRVTSIDGIPLSMPATVDCRTALALRAWVTEGLKPVIGKRGGGVAQIGIMGSYECRPRNNQPGQRISEHGKGKAVDVSGIILKDGEVITVLHDWGRGTQGKILQALHYMACKDFGTVLGPAANSYHRNHFHFDTASYRNGTYCR